MPPETDLKKLLASLKPELHPGEFVYCLVNTLEQAAMLRPLGSFQEQEGVTVILPKQRADEAGLSYPLVCAWITLTVHSSLEAVGLTAVVARALAEANIPCNVVAAFHHDHLFVPAREAERALQVLVSLTGTNE